MASRSIMVHYGYEPGGTGTHFGAAALERGVGYPHACPKSQHLPASLLDGCDGYLWVESGTPSYPTGLESAPVPTAGYLIDVHRHLGLSMLQAKMFDVVFIAQRDHVEEIKESNPNSRWLPLAAPERFLSIPRSPRFDVGFVGSLRQARARRVLLERISRDCVTNEWERHHSVAEMGGVYASSRCVVNLPVNGDLNMRFFEAMACGAVVISPPLQNGLEEIAAESEHYIAADFSDPEEVVRTVKEVILARRDVEIGGRARQLVSSGHTYGHRLDVIAAQLYGSEPAAPIRYMTPAERSRFLLCLARATGQTQLLATSWREERWPLACLPVVGATVASALRRRWAGAVEGLRSHSRG